ncbi:kinase-like domain-containing protein [Lentinula edodes]|uniref:kinase-like domain-containing protein n=1 Tax=Lentinula edodes TaxID=5353 RepID=UPI001E8CB004|nr:kinase-like domain-containing protein [Lentinula edodes]KAH7878729.1 kinase-like domain-containing protein [Lentinula edodes]
MLELSSTDIADSQEEDIINPSDSEDDGDFEIIAEGIASTVSKTLASVDNGEPQLVVVKTSTIIKKWAKEPHDIIKECRILERLSHPNVIPIFDSLLDRSQNTMNIWMPYVPYSLSGLLDSARFVPTPQLEDSSTSHSQAQHSKFLHLARSLMIQIIYGVTYLHAQSIAHRDLKPANVLLTATGRVILIDFGISRDGAKDYYEESLRNGDLWPEAKDSMYFEVSTGPYRAPELLFGTRSYDAYAIDLWSLGAVFAEFFTPLVPLSPTSDDFPSYPSFITSPFTSDSNYSAKHPPSRYARSPLFDASRGEIGLAWSIFKVFGTPREPVNEQEKAQSWAWSGFQDLPDAQKVEFTKVDGVDLDHVLPNLPTENVENPGSAVDLIKSLLRYPPERRMKAEDAQRHPFFSCAERLLPEDFDFEEEMDRTGKVSRIEANGAYMTLGDLLSEALGLA